uniref:Uncharacterized protein n=1 Tax=Romanomermis culicivorax TaxID=13658 RepID=A0A915HX05_ROMCU
MMKPSPKTIAPPADLLNQSQKDLSQLTTQNEQDKLDVLMALMEMMMLILMRCRIHRYWVINNNLVEKKNKRSMRAKDPTGVFDYWM